MSNNTSALIVGIVAAALLCGSAVAVIAIASTNDDGMSNEMREFYAGYAAGYEQGSSERNLFQVSYDKTADSVEFLKTAKMSRAVEAEELEDEFEEVEAECEEAFEVDALVKKTVRSDAWIAGYDMGYFDGREGYSYEVEDDYAYYCKSDKLKARAYVEAIPAAVEVATAAEE